MTREVGRGGMGMHKHGVSGRVPTNKANALARARDVNRQVAEKARQRKARKPTMVQSVKELLQG